MKKNILVIGFLQYGQIWRDLYSLILANFLKQVSKYYFLKKNIANFMETFFSLL
jgi:hypothetical protein